LITLLYCELHKRDMKLYIKNMVCPRCIAAVQNVLNEIDIQPLEIRLGEIILAARIEDTSLRLLDEKLKQLGFELLSDGQQQIIEQIKSIIINQIHYSNNKSANLSEIISAELNRDYSFLSKLFSTTEGITIEHFTILQKVEKVKELLTYNQMNLSEIAFDMGYSSVAHLSAQFKKMTGLTPTQFKAQGISLRQGLDKISGV
jgi:AraC family transcriptional regulator